MTFTLGDCENDVLSLLGSNNPPPNYGVAGAVMYPIWSAVVGSARFDQGLVDNAINRSVQRVISELSDIDLISFSYTFTSSSQTYSYAVPQGNVAQATVVVTGIPVSGKVITVTIGGTPVRYTTNATDTSLAQITAHLISAINASAAVTNGVITQVTPTVNLGNSITITSAVAGLAGNAVTLTASVSGGSVVVTPSSSTLAGGTASSPVIQQIRRVYYQPVGMNYQREKAPGQWLLSWQEFQAKCAGGYLKPFSFAMEPDYVALSPDRTTLQFFPGPASTGDLITVSYVPQMTTGTGQPVLSAQTDIVPLPDDLRDLVIFGAMYWLWPVAGEIGMRDKARTEFKDELQRIRTDWGKGSAADTQRLVDAMDMREQTGWGSFL